MRASNRAQRVGAYSGGIMVLLFLVGFWALAGFVPPPSPALDPEQIASLFRQNTAGIRLGMWLSIMSAALLIPFSATISVQLMRIEGRHAPLAIGQAICGACLVMEFVFPLAVWQNAAFRPKRTPSSSSGSTTSPGCRSSASSAR